MEQYLKILKNVLLNGEVIEGRNGHTLQVTGEEFRWDMRTGFPCLTVRKLAWEKALTELRFFINGLSQKDWLQARGNHFWDKFESPLRGCEGDLGPIYGVQWNNFHGVNQLDEVIKLLKTDPMSRRMVVTSWNPPEHKFMCLPSCHDSFQLLSNGTDLDLIWRQRSVDVAVGLPWDILLYAFLLELLANEADLRPRQLIGQFGSTHVYGQHTHQCFQLINRKPLPPPTFYIGTNKYNNIRTIAENDDCAKEITLVNYFAHEPMHFEVIP